MSPSFGSGCFSTQLPEPRSVLGFTAHNKGVQELAPTCQGLRLTEPSGLCNQKSQAFQASEAAGAGQDYSVPIPHSVVLHSSHCGSQHSAEGKCEFYHAGSFLSFSSTTKQLLLFSVMPLSLPVFERRITE